MTDRRIRCLTIFTIALGVAMLASNQAIPQSAAEKKARIKAANEKKKADAAAKKAKAGERPQREADAAASADSPSHDKVTEAQKAGPQKKPRDWHVGDEPPTDDFGGGFTLQKNFNPDKPARAANDIGQPAAAGTFEYLKQQVLEIKRGQRPGGYSKPAVEQRQRAVDNLKALGPEAIDAVPALASGFSEYFALLEKYEREHPGQEEADAKAYAAAHRGKKQMHVRDLPESWQRYVMTPARPGPDFGETLRRVNNFDARVAAERKLEEQGRRNNGIR